MPHTYTNLLVHIVFATKDRYRFIRPEFEARLYEYIGGAIRGLKGICLELGGVEDHVHILAKLKATMNVSKFLEALKPSVTNWARPIIHPKFEWQDGYGAFSVGESQVPSVRRYIQNQKNIIRRRHSTMNSWRCSEMPELNLKNGICGNKLMNSLAISM